MTLWQLDPARKINVADQPRPFCILGDPQDPVDPPGDPDADELILDDPSAGILDEDYLAGSMFAEIDVSDRVRSLTWSRGRSDTTAHYRAGTATVVLDNRDLALTPALPAVAGELRPGWPILVGARSVTDEPVFVGEIVELVEQRPGDVDRVVIATATDMIGRWSANDPPAQASQGGGEFAGDRLHRIADEQGTPVALRAFDDGDIALQATTLAASSWADALLAADTDGGHLWVTRRGVMTFHDRRRLWEPATVGPVPTLSDSGALETLPILGTVVDRFTLEHVRNDLAVARAGGTAVRVTNDESVSLYGRRTYARSDLLHDDQDDVAQTAGALLAQWGLPDVEFEPLEWSAGRGDWRWIFPVMDLRYGLRISVDGGTLERDVVIEQIRGTWAPKTGWRGTLTVSSVAAPILDVLILDDVDEGLLDTNTLGA